MLGVCSKSSPLYPMNDWVDVNCFFTVGRGITHGMVPYLDLYEQKGPLIYFLYALAALISESSFVGVFVVEVCCFALFLHYSGKIAETISGASWAYAVTAALAGFVIPITPAFSHGGSAEELMLPVLAFSLYTVIHDMQEDRKITPREGLHLGIACAAAFWTKYTFCGLFAGLALGVMIWYLTKRWLRALWRLIGFFLLGMLIPSLLIAAWFALHSALPSMWNAYIVNNLSLYSQHIRGGRYDPPLQNLLNNLPWSVPGALGLLLAWFCRKHRLTALSLWLSAVCLFIFTYLSGRRYPYYALILSVFTSLGPGFACCWIRSRTGKYPDRMRRYVPASVCLLVLISPLVARHLSQNTYLMGTPREEMPQYRFAGQILQTEDRTLINTGFLDGGFYFAAGAEPVNPYFCTLNIDLPEMDCAISGAIRSGDAAYVITRQKKLEEDGAYQLIDSCAFPYEGRDWTYYLYRRSDLLPAQQMDGASPSVP